MSEGARTVTGWYVSHTAPGPPPRNDVACCSQTGTTEERERINTTLYTMAKKNANNQL